MSDIRPLTEQEVFNKVWEHFVVQGHVQSIHEANELLNTSGMCMYKSENSKCAIGLFIPDEEYHASLEGNQIQKVLKSCPSTKVLLGGVSEDFLGSLQRTHDQAMCTTHTTFSSVDGHPLSMSMVSLPIPSGLEPRLRAFAKDYGLEIPEALDV